MADVARLTSTDQKPLYRRYDTILRRLRSALERAQVDIVEVRAVVGHAQVDVGDVFCPPGRA